MLAVIKRPGEEPEMVEMDNTLEGYQQAVGGYIETVRLSKEIVAIVNEEGRLQGLAPNVLGLVGPIVFVGHADCDFRGLTEGEAEFLMSML